MVVHNGELATEGHYTAFVKTPKDNWEEKDDAKTTQVQFIPFVHEPD